ncbi:MAG: Flagellar hook capping protein [Candidatus Moranbacteria bacterium GW2011_GWF2_34_56]|nr:MAG: Flagellar hook capping protein [Candidatus Moranbacteria bacterium GW2011_GWF1_34_10]KKP65047.1 MAG: Flagellar hook capping protein [Candidatus Moranbacteria bacterium GW2011_GWF2_34_56]
MAERIINKLLISIFVLSAIFVANINKASAATNATLVFDQSSVSTTVGQTVNFIARINPGTNEVGGVELYIDFDPAVLHLESITRSGNFNTTLSGPTINNTAGTGLIDAGLLTNPATYITTNADVATFVFTTLSTASNSLISFTETSNASAHGEYVVATRIDSQITIASSGIDVTAPIISNLTIPSTATTLVVPITTFNATDNVAVAGYLLTESATTPSDGASGWSVNAPSNYTFSSDGIKTLYAWAKDADGNVSESLNASITVTLADTTSPLVTTFNISSVIYETLIIPIVTFTATDIIGVTGYMVTESSFAPSAGASEWSSNAPINYTCSSAGEKTLYAWAKDVAGNVSASLNDNAIIIIADTTAPIVSEFDIPNTSFSLTVPVNTLIATDLTDVAGYILTESDQIPLSEAVEWTIDVPSNYTFSSAGEKTLYAWAKDAEGNISDNLSDNVTIIINNITSPMITNGIPVGKLSSKTNSVNLSVITNENAICKFSSNSNTLYDNMSATFSTTGETTHYHPINGVDDGKDYKYYVKCKNSDSNVNEGDYQISFSIEKESSSDDKKKPKRKISNSKTKLYKGETLIQRGSGFSKKADVLLYFTKANGSYYAPLKVRTSSSGKFVIYYRVNKPAGKYSWYVVDTKTGKKSKIRSYTIK